MEIDGMEYEGTVLYFVLGDSFTDVSNCQNSTPKMWACLLFANYTLCQNKKFKLELSGHLMEWSHLIILQPFPMVKDSWMGL